VPLPLGEFDRDDVFADPALVARSSSAAIRTKNVSFGRTVVTDGELPCARCHLA
jgi:hypothetical protein